ncbi:His-Xaa-Ser repeat protein HxsA [Aestuariivirga sp.]|uniref:His-Xaa-Ser repeat protein HxsA n=1 Tax=Aestuariivirga sp. TaxID=2650926 RepID=UPI0039E69DC6
MKRAFLIPSLIAAGLTPLRDTTALSNPLGTAAKKEPNGTVSKIFSLDHRYWLASHSSHSSHASHSSHRSSGTGGYLYDPPPYTPPVYTPNLYSTPTYTPPAQKPPLVTLPGNSNKFKAIVIQVQLALIAYGYYAGEADGKVGPDTRDALSRMQTDYGLKVTGTITPQVLDALRITAQ